MQPSLFDGEPPSTTIILMCAKDGCANPRRRVSGAKYCIEHATSIGYITPDGQDISRYVPTIVTAPGECVVCGKTIRCRVGYLPLCPEDRARVGRCRGVWTAHHVPMEMQIAWMQDPRCWVCGGTIDLSGRTEAKRTAVVDHDHDCCPGNESCGECIRGLAHGLCNVRLGHVERLIRELGECQTIGLVHRLATPSGRAS